MPKRTVYLRFVRNRTRSADSCFAEGGTVIGLSATTKGTFPSGRLAVLLIQR